MEAINLSSKKTLAKQSANKQAIALWFIFGVSAFMLLLFIYTATNKLLEYKSFVFQLQLAPLPMMLTLAPILGWLVPTVELALVAGLYIARTRILSLAASLMLMVTFEGYIWWIKSTGLDLPCTCGGIISAMGWTTHFIFNAVIISFLTTALIIWKMQQRKRTAAIH